MFIFAGQYSVAFGKLHVELKCETILTYYKLSNDFCKSFFSQYVYSILTNVIGQQCPQLYQWAVSVTVFPVLTNIIVYSLIIFEATNK
jgi:hypothetical protein